MRLRIRALLHALRKPFRCLPKRREAERRKAHHGFRPAAEEESLPANAASTIASSRERREIEAAAPSPFGAPPRSCAEGLTSTRLRAALPGITGSKREDPLRHQCSQHLAVRSRAGRSMPKAARTQVTSPPPGTAPAPSIGCHRSTSLRWASLPDVTITGTNVKGSCRDIRDSGSWDFLEWRGLLIP